MNKVGTVDFTILEDGELLKVVEVITRATSAVAREECSAVFDISREIVRSRDRFNQAIGRIVANELTEEIGDADELRGDARSLIVEAAEYNAKKRNVRIADAGKLIATICDEAFADFNLNSNTEESMGIKRFLERMSAPEAIEAADIIRIGDELEDLKSGNDSFNQLSIERTNSKASDTAPRLYPARRTLQRDIRALQQFLNFKIRKDSSFHGGITAQMNGSLSEIMAVAKSRETRKEESAE